MKVLTAIFSILTKRSCKRILYFILSVSMLTCLVPGAVFAEEPANEPAEETVYEFGGDMVITENQYDPGKLKRAVLPCQIAYNVCDGETVTNEVTDPAYLSAILDENQVVYVEMWKLCEELDLKCIGDGFGYTIEPFDYYMHKTLYFPDNSKGFSYSMYSSSVTFSDAPGLLKVDDEYYVPVDLVLTLMDCEAVPMRESEQDDWCLVMSRPSMSVYDILWELNGNLEVYDFNYSEDFGFSEEELNSNMDLAETIRTAYDLISLDPAALADWLPVITPGYIPSFGEDLIPTSHQDYEGMQDFLTMILQADEKELLAMQEKNSPVFGHLFDIITNGLDITSTDEIAELTASLANIDSTIITYTPLNGKWYSASVEMTKRLAHLNALQTGLQVVQGVTLVVKTVLDVSESVRVFSSRDAIAQTAVGAFLENLNEKMDIIHQGGDYIPYVAVDDNLLQALNKQYNGLISNTKKWAVGESLLDNLGSILGDLAGFFSLKISILMSGYKIGADLVNYVSDGAVDAGKSMATSYYGLLYESDAEQYFWQKLNAIPADYVQEDITAVLYAAYNFLKAAYITRNLALDGCKYYGGFEEVKQQSDTLNSRIADMMAVLANATEEGHSYGASTEVAVKWVQGIADNKFYQICIPLARWYYTWVRDNQVPEEGLARDRSSAVSHDYFENSMSSFTGLCSAAVCDMDNDTWPEMITVSGEQNSYPYDYVLRAYGIDHETFEVLPWDETRTTAYIESNFNQGSMSVHIQSSEGIPYIITYCDMENFDAMTWSYINKSVYRLDNHQIIDVTTDTENLGGTSGVSLFRNDNPDTMLCRFHVGWDLAEPEDYTNLALRLEDVAEADEYDITAVDIETYYDDNAINADPVSLLADDIQAVHGSCTHDSTTDDGILMNARYLAENGCTVQIVTDMASGQIRSVTISDNKLYGPDEFLWEKDAFLSSEASDVMKQMYQTVLSSKALAISEDDRTLLANVTLQADVFTDRDQNVFYGTFQENYAGCSVLFQRAVYVVGAERCDSMVTIEIPAEGAAGD